jgi:lycopene cyclase domain-containing protein
MPEYALILLALLTITVFLHRRFKVKLFRSPSHSLVFWMIILAVGIAWDQFAISRGHWSFGEEFLLGLRLGWMPIEEYVFILIVGYFALAVYQIVGRRFRK